MDEEPIRPLQYFLECLILFVQVLAGVLFASSVLVLVSLFLLA